MQPWVMLSPPSLPPHASGRGFTAAGCWDLVQGAGPLILLFHLQFLFQLLSSKQDLCDSGWKARSLNSSMAPSGFGSILSSQD